jgi:hypothetical protein
MKKRKWLIPAVVVSVLLIGGIVGGVVAAGDSSTDIEDQTQPATRYQALLDRACAIYEENTGVAIDSEQLRDALNQAHEEMQEEALASWLQKLVDNGKITQEEADEYLEWWQSRPDIELPGLGGHRHGGGMMWSGGFQPWDGPCSPGAPDEASN